MTAQEPLNPNPWSFSSHISLPESLRTYSREFGEQIYERDKDKYPEHIRPIFEIYCTNTLNGGKFLPFLIETMLEKGMLLPLTEIQKKSVFSVARLLA